MKHDKNGRWGKQYSCNESFFSDYSILSCYYAGLIAADGCIKNDRVFSLSQSGKNLPLLEKFYRDIEYNGKIYEYIPKNGKKSYQVTISSKRIVQDLANNFGILPKKSLTLLPPGIGDKKLILAYVTGLIDGDGSVGVYKRKNKKDPVFRVTLCGTFEITNWVTEKVDNWHPPVRSTKKSSPRKIGNGNTFLFSFSGSRVVKLFVDLKKYNVPLSFKWQSVQNEVQQKGLDYCLEDKVKLAERDKNGRFIKNKI